MPLNSHVFTIKYQNHFFQEYLTKECGFLEQLVISIIMLPNIVGRALCLGVVFGLMKIYGVVILLIVCASQMLSSYLESLVSKTQITSKMFLGILTSFTSPCLIVVEQSKYFLVNGIIGTVLYIVATWILYFNASAIRDLLPDSNYILECHDDISGSTADYIIKCPENATKDIDCYPGIFSIPNSTHRLYTICPENYDQWHLLLIACSIVTGLLCLSMLSVIILHYLINVEKRMVLFQKIKIDTCPQRDASIKEFIVDIMEGKDFEEVQQKTKEATGKPILELMLQSKRIHMTKVSTHLYTYTYRVIEFILHLEQMFPIFRNCWKSMIKI